MLSHLQGKRVLVVEDNLCSATEITDALEAVHAVVVGPCADLDDAELLSLHSELAILDIDIRGRESFALADRLLLLDVPYVFFTSHNRDRIPSRFAEIDVITRPTSLIVALQQLGFRSREVETPAVVDLIPVLRQRARTVLPDPLAADRLVQRTLQMAIEQGGRLPSGPRLELWLQHLMDQALRANRIRFLN
jgi:CheY-like chemotaxis protein